MLQKHGIFTSCGGLRVLAAQAFCATSCAYIIFGLNCTYLTFTGVVGGRGGGLRGGSRRHINVLSTLQIDVYVVSESIFGR